MKSYYSESLEQKILFTEMFGHKIVELQNKYSKFGKNNLLEK